MARSFSNPPGMVRIPREGDDSLLALHAVIAFFLLTSYLDTCLNTGSDKCDST